MVNYASLLVGNQFWEDAFRVFERALVLFGWPHSREIWAQYLTQFVARYGNDKLERARDLFEQCLASAPLKERRRFFLLYIKLEVEHGLRKRAIAIMERATKALPEEERFDLFVLYIRNVEAWHGTVRTRSVRRCSCSTLLELSLAASFSVSVSVSVCLSLSLSLPSYLPPPFRPSTPATLRTDIRGGDQRAPRRAD